MLMGLRAPVSTLLHRNSHRKECAYVSIRPRISSTVNLTMMAVLYGYLC
jgi:hypothetical protein